MISDFNNNNQSNRGQTQQFWLSANTTQLLNNVRNSRFTTVETIIQSQNVKDLNNNDNYLEMAKRSPYIPLNEGYPLKPVFKRSVDPHI